MSDPLVAYDNLTLFLVNWYRARLAARLEPVCQGVRVSNIESDAPKQLIVTDLGGPDTSVLTGLRDVNLSVLAGTRENSKDADDLARIVHALRTQIPSVDPSNPVSAVIESAGPFPVIESQQKARRLITVTFAVVGTLL